MKTSWLVLKMLFIAATCRRQQRLREFRAVRVCNSLSLLASGLGARTPMEYR